MHPTGKYIYYKTWWYIGSTPGSTIDRDCYSNDYGAAYVCPAEHNADEGGGDWGGSCSGFKLSCTDNPSPPPAQSPDPPPPPSPSPPMVDDSVSPPPAPPAMVISFSFIASGVVSDYDEAKQVGSGM